jgi:hypothetical protein
LLVTDAELCEAIPESFAAVDEAEYQDILDDWATAPGMAWGQGWRQAEAKSRRRVEIGDGFPERRAWYSTRRPMSPHHVKKKLAVAGQLATSPMRLLRYGSPKLQ